MGVICWIIGCAVAVAVVYGWFHCSRAWEERKRRFDHREPMSPQEWFTRFCPAPRATCDALTEVLEGLGKEIRVDWTRLRPDDTFTETLRTAKRYDMDGDLDGFEKYGVNADDIETCNRLGDLLEAIKGVLTRSDNQTPGVERQTERSGPGQVNVGELP